MEEDPELAEQGLLDRRGGGLGWKERARPLVWNRQEVVGLERPVEPR